MYRYTKLNGLRLPLLNIGPNERKYEINKITQITQPAPLPTGCLSVSNIRTNIEQSTNLLTIVFWVIRTLSNLTCNYEKEMKRSYTLVKQKCNSIVIKHCVFLIKVIRATLDPYIMSNTFIYKLTLQYIYYRWIIQDTMV